MDGVLKIPQSATDVTQIDYDPEPHWRSGSFRGLQWRERDMSVHAQEIEDITKAVFESLFGWVAWPIHHSRPSMDAARIGSSVCVAGRLSGEVAVMCSVPLARKAAAILNPDTEGPSSDREMFDAVRQIASKVGFELTSAIHPSRVAEPHPASIGAGGMARTIKPSMVFECEGEPCWVLVDAVQTDIAVPDPLPVNRAGAVGRCRSFERVGVDLNVTIHACGRPLGISHARDLSMNGVFVESENPLPSGTDCDIVVHRTGAEGVRVSGRVARNTTTGFAVEFLEVDLASYGQLRDAVRAGVMSSDYQTNALEA